MRKNTMKLAIAVVVAGFSTPVLAGCGEDGDYGAYIRQIESGPQGYSATNPSSSATGAYQFTIGTLKELGYITHIPGPASRHFGNSSWEGVVWSDKARGMGINSRADFKANHGAQDRAFNDLTQRNLQAVSGHWTEGATVNGVQMTQGGVAAAVHMLGAGGFRAWAASGFSPSGLNASIAAAHNWTPEQYNQHLMNRVARGGCMDPGDIEMADIGIHEITELPEIYLMPFNQRPGPAPILPGQIVSLGL